MARHCPERTVLLTAEDDIAETQFRGIPQVLSVARLERRYTIRGRGEDLVSEVIRCVSDHRMRITDFRTDAPTLEDVFLKLTGHSIRD